MGNLQIDLDELLDLLECIQDATSNQVIKNTIDEVISISYDLAKGE